MVLQADWDEEFVWFLEKDDDNDSVPGKLISFSTTFFTTFSSKALRGDDGSCQLSLRGLGKY
jgi:hypothetical protein